MKHFEWDPHRFQEALDQKAYSSNIKSKGKALTIKLINKADLIEILTNECS